MDHANVRIDRSGRAFKGSQLQVQVYVNRSTTQLDNAIRKAEGFTGSDLNIRWVSPLEDEKFREYQDRAFLKALGLEDRVHDLANFWPSGGPVWDGLARIERKEDSSLAGVLLVEGKSYPEEMRSAWGAKSGESKKKIEEALDRTCKWLGIQRNPAWTDQYYQLANRLAHLYFFRTELGIDAWLCSLCFLDDPHRPTSDEDWRKGLKEAATSLGLPAHSIPGYLEIFLPAKSRQELL